LFYITVLWLKHWFLQNSFGKEKTKSYFSCTSVSSYLFMHFSKLSPIPAPSLLFLGIPRIDSLEKAAV